MISALEAQNKSRGRQRQSSLLDFSGGGAPEWVRGNAPEEGTELRLERWAQARSANGSTQQSREKDNR